MITIKDKALGKYSVVEDFQGLKVVGEDGKTLVKVNAFEEALRYIASRLILDYDATYTLAAQEGVHQEEIPFEEVNG
jgi:hypothetical protein